MSGATLVGTTQRVLIEGPDKDSGLLWTGRSERNEIVHVAKEVDPAHYDVTAIIKHLGASDLAAVIYTMDSRSVQEFTT